jgi:hypothetical protein
VSSIILLPIGMVPPGSPSKIMECCKVPELIPQDVFEKCEKANPKPPGPPKGKFIRRDQKHKPNLHFTFAIKLRLLYE